MSKCSFNSCKNKLFLTDYPCKCGVTYCSSHRHAEVHNCTFNYKENAKNKLLETLSEPIVKDKIQKI